MNEFNTETIVFQIDFQINAWDKPVDLEILVDDILVGNYSLYKNKSVKFQQKLIMNQDHKLIIHRTGKTLDQTDQTANIESIFIDNINVKDIVVSSCEYYPDYPEPWASEQQAMGIDLEYPVKQELYFGHNGIWKYSFSSPFYRYLLHRVTGV